LIASANFSAASFTCFCCFISIASILFPFLPHTHSFYPAQTPPTPGESPPKAKGAGRKPAPPNLFEVFLT
jgi:hypothetical protein